MTKTTSWWLQTFQFLSFFSAKVLNLVSDLYSVSTAKPLLFAPQRKTKEKVFLVFWGKKLLPHRNYSAPAAKTEDLPVPSVGKNNVADLAVPCLCFPSRLPALPLLRYSLTHVVWGKQKSVYL